jgi:hypothetical protein
LGVGVGKLKDTSPPIPGGEALIHRALTVS